MATTQQPTEPDANRPLDVAGDALHVRRVFGEPYEVDGTMIVPVAKVVGGGGTGYGSGAMGEADAGPEGSGGGGGFAVRAKPVGVYVVQEGRVTWQPAMDLTRVILGGQVLSAVAVLALVCALRRRRRHLARAVISRGGRRGRG